jgi:tocopherol cyclase
MGNSGFRGSLKSKSYFEGWYLKQVSGDRTSVYSFIPGVSLNKKDPHAFIQIINGISGETHYITYPLDQFKAERNIFDVTIGDSHFSAKGCEISIKTEEITCTGSLTYGKITPYPSTLLTPDIMGWFSYVPFMECLHDIVSLHHSVDGLISVNGTDIDFGGGDGYIEKDRGRSFPSSWIWAQCNSFTNKNTSLMLSIATIPWLGKSFAGFLGFIHFENETIPFATWNGSKIKSVDRVGKQLSITVENRKYTLELTIVENSSGTLIAPVTGSMDRHIKESVDSKISFSLFRGEELVVSDKGTHAGLEIIDSIFPYLASNGVAVNQKI